MESEHCKYRETTVRENRHRDEENITARKRRENKKRKVYV